MTASRLVLALALLAALAGPARAAPKPAPDLPEIYTVVDGDSCASIVKKFKIKLKDLHRLNPQLLKPPHHLTGGLKLLLKPGPDARLTFVQPRVETRKPSETAWALGKVGAELGRLSRVATRDDAAAELMFLADQSRLLLRSNSLLIVYGGSAQAKRDKGPDRGVELVEGTLRGGLSLLRAGAKPFEVATPAARVKVSSRDLKLEVTKRQASLMSVFDGRAEMSAMGKAVDVPAGQGTVTEKGKAPETPRPLPPAPSWTSPLRQTVPAPSGAIDVLKLTWGAVPNAARYNVEVCRDMRFNECVLAREQPAAPPELELKGVKPGRLWVRVSTIDSAGLQSVPSETAALQVVPIKVEGARREPDGTWFLEPGGRFTLPERIRGELQLDGIRSPRGSIEVSEGEHVISIVLLDENFPPAEIKVRGGKPKLMMSASPQELGPEGGEVAVRVTDVSGPPTFASGVPVRTDDGKELPLMSPDRVTPYRQWIVGPTKVRRVLRLRAYMPGSKDPVATLELVQRGPDRE